MRNGLIHTGFSLFAPDEQRLAALPLLEAGIVDAIEWTFDHGWARELPEWVIALLDAYGAEDRLYGHGINLSPTSARDDHAATSWLANASREVASRRYRHVTEHWGFSRARGLVRGAPLPLVSSEAVVACATRSLHALATATRLPVGLENLALAFGPDDVDAQPAMITRVLDALERGGTLPASPVGGAAAPGIDGVLLLDLHNLWCQAVNYERDVRELASQYPLARVRQLHVSGGSWSASAIGPPFRRDTHDALVPDEVMELVAWAIPRCPALEVVILERLPDTLPDDASREAWRAEWKTLAEVVRGAAREPIVVVPPSRAPLLDTSASVDDLARYQDALVAVLLATNNARDAHAAMLAHPDVAPFRDQVARFEPRAFEVAISLANKWGVLDGGQATSTAEAESVPS